MSKFKNWIIEFNSQLIPKFIVLREILTIQVEIKDSCSVLHDYICQLRNLIFNNVWWLKLAKLCQSEEIELKVKVQKLKRNTSVQDFKIYFLKKK